MKRLLSGVLWLGLLAGALAAERPNFVWLVSEDNSLHYLDLYREMGTSTPRIAELAQQGLVFEHAFSNAPVCSVARTTLMTGCFAPRIGTQFHRRSVTVPLPDGVRMFPYWLREAGYYTTNNRKKDYNAVEGEGVWDASSGRASWRGRKEGQPFFHMQSFGVSHESSLHFSREVFENERTETSPDEVILAPYHPDTPLFRYTYARYHDRIRTMDRQIGEVVDRLREDGLLENTFIFYFGDHGGVLPGSKGYAKERGLHVPLVVRVPEKFREGLGFEIGSRVDGFVSFIDFGPTLLHLAGLPVPKSLDGKAFLGAGIDAQGLSTRDETFGYADRFDEKYDLVRWFRKGNYSYVRSFQPFNFDGLQNNYRYKMLAYEEWRSLYEHRGLNQVQRAFFEVQPVEALYDVSRDPHEVDNLAALPEYAEVLERMRSGLFGELKSWPDLSFFPENALVESGFSDPTGFGQQASTRITRFIETANLALKPYAGAGEGIRRALASADPWERYWGVVAASSHGGKAVDLAETIGSLAENDPVRMVRVRAAEFLGLTRTGDPRPAIDQALRESTSGIEVALILNTVVLLRDGAPGYEFEIDPNQFPAEVLDNLYVKWRLEYLVPGFQSQ